MPGNCSAIIETPSNTGNATSFCVVRTSDTQGVSRLPSCCRNGRIVEDPATCQTWCTYTGDFDDFKSCIGPDSITLCQSETLTPINTTTTTTSGTALPTSTSSTTSSPRPTGAAGMVNARPASLASIFVAGLMVVGIFLG